MPGMMFSDLIFCDQYGADLPRCRPAAIVGIDMKNKRLLIDSVFRFTGNSDDVFNTLKNQRSHDLGSGMDLPWEKLHCLLCRQS